jgi:hypothetical protein
MSIRYQLAAAIILCAAFASARAQRSPEAVGVSANNLRLAAAQTHAAAKSKGPSLEFTLEYIQDKLISRGVLSYTVSLHDAATGKDWSYEFVDKLTGTYANPRTCQIGFHWKQTRSGEAVTDKETYLDLTGGTKADVLTMDQYLTESAAKSGHGSWEIKVSPSLSVLRITQSDKSESNYVFPDEDTADHLAKALVHAAELCEGTQGAGVAAAGKEPF